MKTVIRKSQESKTGYEMVIIDDENNESIYLLNDKPKNEPFTLILPENPSNRKYFNTKKVDNSGGEIELTYKETMTFGPRSETNNRKPLEDYLNDEDKKLYLSLIEKAKKNREEATKKQPLTEIEKAKLRVERAEKAYEALLKKQQQQ